MSRGIDVFKSGGGWNNKSVQANSLWAWRVGCWGISWVSFTNSGSMTYSERKRVASAKYYRNKLQSAERVREHKRIQMAQKRAEKKAKRQRSDKPTIESETTTGIARPQPRAQRRAEAALTIANDAQIESRYVSDAERDASESLVLMSKLHTPKAAIRNISPDIFEHWQDSPRVYEGGNSNSADSEEDEMGVRSTSQFSDGVQEDLHEEQRQSPKRTCTREALLSDACFKSCLQPVFGVPDAKSD
ncbi:hypothetical protein B0H14DRAFT_2605355 [Mycena olivaceomarginata]|nr:hypothetical protein B0H14DRAFT_2605355 [Mycena olivaceomarginata]